MIKVNPVLQLSAVLCLSGFAMVADGASPTVATQPNAQQHMDKIASCIRPIVLVKDDPHPCTALSDLMTQSHVHGVSIAVIHNGTVEWARGFGVKRIGGDLVSTGTLFQAGSISKPLAAMAALHLVQAGKLSLDADVNTELTSWKIPQSPAANGKPVTLRELLTHTAGMTVHGFPGYAAGAPVPTLVQVLNGQPPANTSPIRIESEPGSRWNYSGGGYTVMQQLLLDTAKEPFPLLLQSTVLTPIGMTHSTYQQPLPADRTGEAATPYDHNGSPIPGGAHTYPEMAAAGLWTTPSDLAKYAIEVEQSLQEKANHVLSKEMTQQMLTPGKGSYGLGLEIGGSASDPYFSHGGVNEGFENLFVAYEKHGDGAVVMTNAEGGLALARQIMQSIAAEYGWPDFRPIEHTEVKVDRATLAHYTGVYQIAPTFSLTITLEGGQLMSQGTGQEKLPIFPESPTKFFLKVVDAQIEFFTDDKGQTSALILHQDGQEIRATRK